MSERMQFRADINGLRAIAVLAVIAFHFAVPGISGGFVGVDIFFVISGFLMTGIVTGRLDRGTFSIPDFYLDRGRRIVPALAVLVVAVLAAGTIWLLPQDLLVLGKHVASAVTFGSNILFWRESGYFDAGSARKFLLHTWSLSVEWQFYLLYPLLILAAVRTGGRRALLPVLAAAAALSLALALWLAHHHPTAAFFLLPARAWEMIAGGIVLLAPPLPAPLTRPAQLTGLALIAIAVLTARSAGWPGAATLLPVVGSALVIAARRVDSRVTANPVAAWIGLNSYSIYLWHWPVAVLIVRYDKVGDWRWTIAGIALSLLLGYLSFRFVERGGRKRERLPRIHTGPQPHGLRRHAILLAPVLLLACAGIGVWTARGLPMRFSAEVRALEADTLPGGPWNHRCFATTGAVPAPCIVGPGDDRHALVTLLGDSHAESAAGGLVAALPPGASGGVAFDGYAACAPLLGAASTDPENRCRDYLARYLVPQTRPRTTPLILIANWQAVVPDHTLSFDDDGVPADMATFRRRLLATGCTLAKAGPTYLMLPTPSFPMNVATTLQWRLIHDPATPDITLPIARHLADNRALIALFGEVARTCGIRLLDPLPYLCPGGRCRGSLRHRAIVRDRHHLTEYGNRLLTPLFASVLAH